MSATIPENMLLSDLLKSTGYDCPDSLKDKTFDESTSGGSEVVLEDNKEVTITENGTVEITPSEGKDGMKKVTATVNVAGGGDIEANKEATIDVSQYSAPVEITPTAGKDGMAKVTVALENIPSPSGGSWHNISDKTTLSVAEIISSSSSIVAFRMTVSTHDAYVKGSIVGGDGDGGITVSACGIKIFDYWEQPANCFFDTGFYIDYNGVLWSVIATAILDSYNTSTSGSATLTSFEIYY